MRLFALAGVAKVRAFAAEHDGGICPVENPTILSAVRAAEPAPRAKRYRCVAIADPGFLPHAFAFPEKPDAPGIANDTDINRRTIVVLLPMPNTRLAGQALVAAQRGEIETSNLLDARMS
ncbi:hypothetical protein [Hyphomicrobium sp. 2TAF46]|uniref:hypothetical protein n=1 Tax=Hyphomicrobium sp. 2TAF46 TaxID=3233019 RepID=UPI003F907874